jgi:eukaryotic-like serine/threonine-protein kinase
MPALLANDSADLASADLSATALLDGPLLPPPVPGGDRSGLIDEAYSEYRKLCAAGVAVDPDAFCARFPAYQTSLRRLLDVHRQLQENPDLIPQTDRWPAAGQDYFGFRLETELGRGAFARVFLAREPAVGNRQVVVKVSLHADDEAGTLGKLRHPNVASVHSAQFDADTGFAVVCMPFLGGTTLLPVIDSLVAGNKLPVRASLLLDAAKDDRWPAESGPAPARAVRRGSYLDGVLYLGERLAGALAYVHERGILHRDLKPSNVLLCPNGEPILIDFNLAHDRTIAEHRVGGTLPYMPPEQLEAMGKGGDERHVPTDPRSDVYALGVILYELLTGAHPFGPVPVKLKTSDARDFLIRRQRRGPTSLRARNRAVDPAVDRLILRCLSAEPAGRPATARELADELRRLQSPAGRLRRWVVGHVKAAAAIGLLVASGTAAAVEHYATLPGPAAVHAQKGNEFYRDGAYAKAIEEYSVSLGENPDQPAVHYALARAYMKLGTGHYQFAIDALKKADWEHDGRAAATLGYCCVRMGQHVTAIEANRAALAAGAPGASLAAVHNNLAVSLFRQPKPSWAAAEQQASEAIRVDPTLMAAFYNRAGFRRSMAEQDKSGIADALDGLTDARTAISLSGDGGSPMLHLLVAELCATCVSLPGVPPDPDLVAEGIEHLKHVVDRGYSRSYLKGLSGRRAPIRDWVGLVESMAAPDSLRAPLDQDIRFVDPISD